jgi:hypothetical protein
MKKLYTLLLGICMAQTILSQTPPATWTEHWFEHNQTLTRKFYDNDVAIYYDNDVNSAITWPYTYMGDVWRYTKSVYGNFGTENRLYAIFHTNKYSGGHPSTYFDASHDSRNVTDVGPGPWTNGSGNDLDLNTHEVAHIVEGAAKGYHNSPAFGLWGDSKWAEIFIYDVYKGLNRTSDVTRWYNLMINGTDNFPQANTHWFRDWFYPIYNNYGGAQALNGYFTKLAQYFPKSGTNYSRSMNWGEFVHFWSGAAGINLKPLATAAFGWPASYETQFNQARIDFPFTYPDGVATFYKDCSYGGNAVSLPAGSYTLAQLQAKGILNDDISSLKVRSGYKVTLYWDNNFAGTTLVKTADDDCLVNDNWNDKASSLVIAQNTSLLGGLSSAITGLTPERAAATEFTFEVYPNHSRTELRILSTENITGGLVLVYDIMGRQVINTKPNSNTLDVARLTTGIYTLVYTKQGRSVTRRFLK